MKRLRFLLLSAALAAALSSCRSSDAAAYDVHPLALLDSDSSIYVGIPVQAQKDALLSIVSAIDAGSQGDAKKLLDRCNTIYVGLSSPNDKERLQVSVDGSFPSIGVGMAMKEKNGWKKEKRSFEGEFAFSTNVYTSTGGKELQVSFPQSSLLCAGRNVEPLLQKYAGQPGSVPEGAAFGWVANPTDKIRFFMRDPGKFISAMLGSPIEIALASCYGTACSDGDGGLLTDLYLELKAFNVPAAQKASAKALSGLLRIAFGFMGGVVEQEGEGLIHVSGLVLSPQYVAGMFAR